MASPEMKMIDYTDELMVNSQDFGELPKDMVEHSPFEHVTKTTGINWNVETALADTQLRSSIDFLSALRTDWMHGEVQHGAFSFEVAAFLRCCEQAPLQLTWQFWRQVNKFF